MNSASTPPETSATLVLEYRLTEEDVHRYCLAGRARKCWRWCLERKVATLMLVSLALFLFAHCYQARGIRSATLAAGTTLVIVVALAWSRQARSDGHLCRLAGQMGLPEDYRLVVSPGGIIQEPGARSAAPILSITWPEVLEISRVDGLTVLRLRRGGCLLFIPDRTFPDSQALEGFALRLRTWREAALR